MVIGSNVNGKDKIAVNEFLITPPDRRRLINYDIYINDNLVANHQGDGTIIATATGSTAYALSAGGAIMSPTSHAMQIVPLAPHTLNSRPIVVGNDDFVRIIVHLSKRSSSAEILADGSIAGVIDVEDQDTIDIKVERKGFVEIWRPSNWNFFDVLSEKMGWNK